ncbi:TonB-dependent receptor [Maribellus sp. YY47]|uniref:SusC/RagA family TonB-linked outer membrane protein n=1 Tax=Maribellus sp. YY47 TaxID=2929486 RepID=UPI002001BE84|nr:TonB-dependent receptor [Maribellus sp. YY47]MCK3685942.1 TonB-dependent receptor [Maribellus sp. YY47]
MRIIRKNLKVVLFLVAMLGFSFSYAQVKTITGKVTDAGSGEPLPGVTIVVKGTTNGTITNFDGDYSIKVDMDQILQFSFVGYLKQEITVGNQNVLNVQLKTDTEQLEEVVVVGYGIQKKREIVGSIAKVESEDIGNKLTSSFEGVLAGQASGVSVTTGSGMAGSSAIVRVRGVASINSAGDPLYVVDGIPITNDIFGLGGRTGGMNVNPLSSINANDIESIEVLKDASATGIYGSRGANGVILITTKKAKGNEVKVEFSTKQSISNPTKKVNMTNSAEWLQLYKEAWENDGNTGIPTGLPGGLTWQQAQNTDTDWWDQVTRTGHKQDYNLNANFGLAKNLIARINWGVTQDNTYLVDNDLERINLGLNLQYIPSSKFSSSFSSTSAQTSTSLPGNPWDGGLGAAMGYALPIYPIYNSDGTFFRGGGNSGNPVMMNKLRDDSNDETRLINALTFNYSPTEKVSFNFSGALDYMNFNNDGTESGQLRSSGYDYRWENNRKVYNWNYSIVANYDFQLANTDHDLKAMLGHELQESLTTGTNYNWDYSRDEVKSTEPLRDEHWRFISFFGRMNYMYKSRYIAQATLRTDGSSRFGKNNKYGYFPTVALGWIVSEENFLKNSSVISFLKLKASYGITGNSNIPNYEHIGTYRISTNENEKYNELPIRYPEKFANPDLKWETTNSYDLGIDARFFDGRISTEAAYYFKESKDVFVNLAITATSGYGSQWQNLATIENEGLEFSITTQNLVGEFEWETQFNITTLRNEVTDLGGLTTEEIGGGTNDTRILKGYPVGTNRLVRVSRIDPADGRPVYLDKDGNETKTYKFEGGEGFAVAAGKVIPDFTGGFTNTFRYKNLSLSALFTFSVGAQIYDSSAKRQMGLASDWNFRTDIFDHWREPGDIAKYPRMSREGATYGKDGEQWFNSTMWLFDGDYLRLKNLTLSYSIPPKALNKFGISGTKLFVTGTNLLTFTKYPGADPEVARDHDDPRDRNMSANVSFLTPPQERVYTVGLNVTF